MSGLIVLCSIPYSLKATADPLHLQIHKFHASERELTNGRNIGPYLRFASRLELTPGPREFLIWLYDLFVQIWTSDNSQAACQCCIGTQARMLCVTVVSGRRPAIFWKSCNGQERLIHGLGKRELARQPSAECSEFSWFSEHWNRTRGVRFSIPLSGNGVTWNKIYCQHHLIQCRVSTKQGCLLNCKDVSLFA